MLIDAHCHLESMPKGRVLPLGMRLVSSGFSFDSSRDNLALARSHANVVCTAGIAPQTAQKIVALDEELARFAAWFRTEAASDRKIVAVGEIGLDYHWGKTLEERDRQKIAFEFQLDLASELGLPLVIHCRDAYTEVYAALSAFKLAHPHQKIMMHCFSGTAIEASRFVALGALISIIPRRHKERQQCIKETPPSQLLAETDAPYIGQTPEDVEQAYAMISEYKGVSLREVELQLEKNARAFFGW